MNAAPDAAPTFDALALLEPRLALLAAEARRLRRFRRVCSRGAWRGVFGLGYRLSQLAGPDRRRRVGPGPAERTLRSAAAYAVARRHLLALLPPCGPACDHTWPGGDPC